MEEYPFNGSNEVEGRAAVPAIAKAVRVLDQLANASAGLGVSEVARRTGLSKSTVHGLMAALADENLIVAIDGSKAYHLGPRLAALGARAREQRLLDIVEAELDGLAGETGETVLFGQLDGSRVHILAARQGPRVLNLSARIGSSVSVLAGVLGKAYLASMPAPAADAFLKRTALPRHTDRSITSSDQYLNQAAAFRQAGYAVERGEYLPGIAAAASAFAWLGVTYFLWAVGIDANHSDEELERLGHAVRDAALRIAPRLAD